MRKLNLSTEEARLILGKLGENMTDLQILNIISMFQILCEAWLDNYERKIFKGKTLREIVDGV